MPPRAATPRGPAAGYAAPRIWELQLCSVASRARSPARGALPLAVRRHPQALNLAADASLSATSVRALFADWLAKFKRAYRKGDEVRRLLRALGASRREC